MNIRHNRIAQIVLGTFLLLLLPLVAMQFSDEVQWSLGDFIVAGVLIAGTGFGFDFIARTTKTSKQKLVFGLILAFVFVVVWAELAVGLFGTPFAGN